jgi:hypothetical protein
VRADDSRVSHSKHQARPDLQRRHWSRTATMQARQQANDFCACALVFRATKHEGSRNHASAPRWPCIFSGCRRDHGEHRLVGARARSPRWRSPRGRGCASSPTSWTTTGYGAPCGTAGNGGAARRAGVPCGSPATASSYGPAGAAAHRGPARTSRATRGIAATRDPSHRAAAAPSDDEIPSATYRRSCEPKHIARCGRATVAKGTGRNAGDAA